VTGEILQVVRFRYRSRWSRTDTALREAMPTFQLQAGLIAAWMGRQGPDFDDERAIASVWTSAATERTSLQLAELLGPTSAADVDTPVRVTMPTSFHEDFPRATPATILRIYEGRTRRGELDAYVAEARDGVLLDGENPDGPVSVTMSIDAPDRFVTVSTWTDWRCIERCTGGDRDRPLVTRNAARLVGGGPRHYELFAIVRSPLADI
jgi:hypothetical protein